MEYVTIFFFKLWFQADQFGLKSEFPTTSVKFYHVFLFQHYLRIVHWIRKMTIYGLVQSKLCYGSIRLKIRTSPTFDGRSTALNFNKSCCAVYEILDKIHVNCPSLWISMSETWGFPEIIFSKSLLYRISSKSAKRFIE